MLADFLKKVHSDFHGHERREDLLATHIAECLMRSSISVTYPRQPRC